MGAFTNWLFGRGYQNHINTLEKEIEIHLDRIEQLEKSVEIFTGRCSELERSLDRARGKEDELLDKLLTVTGVNQRTQVRIPTGGLIGENAPVPKQDYIKVGARQGVPWAQMKQKMEDQARAAAWEQKAKENAARIDQVPVEEQADKILEDFERLGGERAH